MVRKMFGTICVALLLCVSAVLAGEVKGKVTKVDADKSVLTINADGTEKEYKVAADCKMPTTKGKDGNEKAMTLAGLAKTVDRMKDKGGVPVVATTEKKDDKETIVEIKVDRPKGKKKDA